MELFPKFINDAAGPPAQAIGNTLATLWELGVGSHISLWKKKQELRQQINFQDYVKRVEEKTQKIPEEFLQEPQMHIVGPAIEASKFYIDSEELRDMFANLIAASIDSRKIEQTHPSFVEIIKQMSPIDAGILANFKNSNQWPIAQIRLTKANKAFNTVQNHLMNFDNQQIYKLYSSSLSNLERLGLLSIDYGTYSADEQEYAFIKEHPAFQAATEKLLETQKFDPSFINVDFQKGLCFRTPLCEDFISVCL